MTSEAQSRFITHALTGDEGWATPSGTKAYTYFKGMPTEEAWGEFRQIRRLPEGDRPRDLLERMGEDR